MPLARHDSCAFRINSGFLCFYSHASCEALQNGVRTSLSQSEVSTHMPLARHDGYIDIAALNACVSTHMPLARHDIIKTYCYLKSFVSTHMPLARHDLLRCRAICDRNPFLLTCLLRGMTACTVSEPRNLKVSTHMPLARHDKQ